MRKKKTFRKKRVVKRRTFKRYTKKRFIRKRRVARRGRSMNLKYNASLNMAKFRIRLNRRNLDLGDKPEIIHLGNPADLTYSALTGNMPLLGNYNQWRIDKIVTHWRVLQKNIKDWRGDVCNHALCYSVPNDSVDADGQLEDLMFNTSEDKLNALLLNYDQLRGVYFRKCSWKYGSRTYRPYVTELINTYAKNTTAAPSLSQDLRRNYKKTFRYASSAVRYEAPLFLLVPGLTKTNYDISGSIPVVTSGATTIVSSGNIKADLDMAISDYPILEIWSEVYVTAKQCKTFSNSIPPARLMTTTPAPPMDIKLEPEANEINLDFNKVKEDVQQSVMDQITGSHPVIAAVATVAGLRKRPRHDEFKM